MPFRVVSRTNTTVTVQIDGKLDRLSLDKIVAQPAVEGLMRREVLRDEKHKVQNERVEKKVTGKR